MNSAWSSVRSSIERIPESMKVNIRRSAILFVASLLSLWVSTSLYCLRYGLQLPFAGVPYTALQHTATAATLSILTVVFFFAIPRALSFALEDFYMEKNYSTATRMIIGMASVIASFGTIHFISWISPYILMDPLPTVAEYVIISALTFTFVVSNVLGKRGTEAMLSGLFWLLLAGMLIVSISPAYSNFLAYLRIGGGVQAAVTLVDGTRIEQVSIMLITNDQTIFWNPRADAFVYAPKSQILALEIPREPKADLPLPLRDI
jgi:hypothetical protein